MSQPHAIINIYALSYAKAMRLFGTINDGNLHAKLYDTSKCIVNVKLSNGGSTAQDFRNFIMEGESGYPGVPRVWIYAGHGAQKPVTRGTRPGVLEDFHGNQAETDGKEECFVMEDGSLFTDTEFGSLMTAKCPRMFITDCCHSDTLIEMVDNSYPIITISACLDSECTPEYRCKNFRGETLIHGRLTDTLTKEFVKHISTGFLDLKGFVSDESSIYNITCGTVRVNQAFKDAAEFKIPVSPSIASTSRSVLGKDCVSVPSTPCDEPVILTTKPQGKIKARGFCTSGCTMM